MKQTNNAIKFLMAQYRAIFKNAYFKGLTSAVLLTASMAVAGGVQAAATTIERVDALNQALITDGTDSIEFDGTTYTSWITNDKASTATAPEVINGDMVINSSGQKIYASTSGDTNFYTNSSHDLILKKDSSYNIGDAASQSQFNGTWNNITLEKGSTLNVIGGSGSSSSAMASTFATGLGTVSVDNATVNLTNQETGNAVLRGATINVTGKDAVVNVGAEYATGKDGGYAALGWRDEVTLGDNNRPNKYTLEYGSNISFSNGATLNLTGHSGATANAYQTIGSQVMGKSLTVDNGHVNVNGYGAQIFTHTNTFTNTNFHVASGAQLVFQPFEFRVRTDDNTGNHKLHGYSFINGSSTFDGGNFIVEGYVTAAGTVAIHDNVNFTAGNATIDTTSNEENKRNHGVLAIGLDDGFFDARSDDLAIDTASRLEISSSQLSKFLTKTNTQTVVKNAQGTETTYADNAGVLAFGAGDVTLAFTDTTQVDMHQFNWVKANMGTSGATNTTEAGAIVTDINLVGDTKKPNSYEGDLGVTVTATDMRIARALGTNDEGADEITFEADRMTLGSEKGDSTVEKNWKGFESSAAGLGVKAIIAHDELIVVDGLGSDYTLQNKVTLTRDFYTKDASGNYTTTANTTGLITGDNLVIGGDTEGTLTINGGAWQNDARQSLTIASGSLSINASAFDKNGDGKKDSSDAEADGLDYHGNNTNRNYYINGNPSSLTWNGAFVIKGGDPAKADVKVTGAQGADATLDLRNASVTWGSGAVTLSGNSQDTSKTDPDASAGEGILYITGNQFNSFLGNGNTDTNGKAIASQTKLNINNDGVLFVDGPVTGNIDFGTFTNVESGNATAQHINFVSGATSGEGTLYINGGISLVTGNGSSLDIGNGTIDAQTISINDNSIASDDRGDIDVDKVTVAQGTLEVSSSLTSNNAVVEFGEGSSGATLILDTDGGANSVGSVTSNLVFNGANSSLVADEGTWSLAAGKDITLNDDASFEVGTGDYDVRGIKASLTADNLQVTASGNNTIYGGSSVTFNTLQAGTATFNIGGTLTVLGRSDIDTSANSTELDSVQDAADTAGIELGGATFNVDGTGAKFELGEVATASLVTIGTETSGTGENATTTTKVTVADTLDDAIITLSDHGALRLNFAENTKINADAARQLKTLLLTPNSDGLLEVGKAKLDIKYDDPTNLITSWDNVKDFVNVAPDVASDDLLNTLVNDVDLGTIVAGNFGAIQTNFSGPTQLQIDGDLGLHNARNGYFVFHDNNGTPEAIGVALASNSELYLEGAGKIGAISGTLNGGSDVTIAAKTDADGNVIAGTTEVLGAISNIDDLSVENNTTVAGNITANFLGLDNGISLSNGTHDMTFAEVYQGVGAELSTKNLTITGRTGNALGADSVLQGTTTVADTLTIGDSSAQSTNNEVVIANGSVVADKLVMHSGSSLSVGYKAQDVDSDPNDGFDETVNYSGELQINTADLNGASIIIDPVTSTSTAVASFAQFADAVGTNHDLYNAGTIDGNIFVGANSAAGIGTRDLAELREGLAEYQNSNGALADYGALVFLDKNVAVADGNGITMTAQSVKDFSDYMSSTGTGKYFAAQVRADNTIANTMYFGADTAVIVHAEALNAQHSGLTGAPTALVTFASNNAQLIADGGEILVNGQVRANRSYTFFKDGDGKVAVVDITGNTSGAGIDVYTENGFLYGEINNENGGTLELKVNDTRSLMAGASDPVYTTLVAYAQGYNGTKDTDTADGDQTDYLYNGYTTQEVAGEDGQTTTTREKNLNYSNYFLDESIAVGNGAAAESVARLAIYGGAAQAVISAGASTYDAVSGRMGVGANGANITVADNTQGAALWLAPIYKSSDSDGFDAEGLDYGVDMDLYGVALGADYTLSNGIRFGAMFNVGSGEVDGQGAGSAVSNDFDYYGFAVYGGYSMGALSVVADVSYTVADNDLEGNTTIDKVGASLDSTNLSIGVTGQYQLDFNGTTVTPHAGLRFSRIDLDDYTVDGEDIIADYDADSMNIFSIPVGVTFAKEFTGDAWTVKPSLDLTLTGNFGDDETEGTVHWAGVDNLSTNVSSEVLDNFTYGATLGVAAKTGNFSLGLGVNYTGSSNVDEFGVNANARFVF